MREKLITVASVLVMLGAIGGLGVYWINGACSYMTGRNFYRFDREHDLIHGYDRRETKRLAYLGKVVVLYAQAHKGVLPSLGDQAALRSQLHPAFVKDEKNFIDPHFHIPFASNPGIAGVKLRSIKDPGHCVAFYQSSAPPKYQFIMYVTLDGVVHTAPEPQFRSIRPSSM